MKKILSKLAATRLIWVAVCAILFSFSPKPGGDTYKVFLDDKLVLEEYVHNQKSIPSLPLDPKGSTTEVTVYYNHCGQLGTARNITIKDELDNVLKQWHFVDAAPMICKAKEIAALSRGGNNTLRLYYSSKEIPKGKLLVNLRLGKDAKTAINQ